MSNRHTHPPISFRPPEPLREWLSDYAQRHDRPVRGVITEALEEYRARREQEGTYDMQAMTTALARDCLDRAFRYDFMRPDQMAWVPIRFPGIEYNRDGTLSGSMQTMGTLHLIEVLRRKGCVIRFSNGTDVGAALHHVLWDQWTKEEIGNGRFTGRLFDDHGKIYHGCTADDAASYAVERIAALGGAFTQRLDDEHLDVYERWARESLEPVLGTLRVIDRKSGPPGLHDFEVNSPAGTVAAVEVTSVVEPERLSVESELRRRGLARIELPGLTSRWGVGLADNARVKVATRRNTLQQLLGGLEAQGLRYAHDMGDYRDPVVDSLRKLGIASVYRLSAEHAGTVLISTGAYGGIGWDGPAIDAWLQEFVASDQGVNKLQKLGRAKAAERHLAIVLDSFSQPGIGISLALTARHERGAADYAVPSFAPPEPVTHLWLLPMVQSGERLCWSRDSGWAVLAG